MNRVVFAGAVLLLTACGPSQPAAQNPSSPPPKLPPSMTGGGGPGGAGGGDTPPTSDMPATTQQNAPSEEIKKGMDALDKNDLPGAKAAFGDAINKHPNDGEGHAFLALTL